MKFNEYYQHYLSLHQNKWCRRLHMLGLVFTVGFVAMIMSLCYSKSAWFLLLLPLSWFVVYPFAWVGHFLIEKNKPAAFRNPWLAKLSDWRMFFDVIRGRIPF